MPDPTDPTVTAALAVPLSDAGPAPVDEEAQENPPVINLTPDDLDALDLHDCKPGQSYTGNLTFRVASADDTGKSLELTGLTDVAPIEGAASEEAAEGEPPLPEAPTEDTEDVLGYRRPKKGPGAPINISKLRSTR